MAGPQLTDALIRCSPGEDEPGTNGFFVSCFIREGSHAVAPRKKKSLKRRISTVGTQEDVVAPKRQARKLE